MVECIPIRMQIQMSGDRLHIDQHDHSNDGAESGDHPEAGMPAVIIRQN
jgi:hypothetical protein